MVRKATTMIGTDHKHTLTPCLPFLKNFSLVVWQFFSTAARPLRSLPFDRHVVWILLHFHQCSHSMTLASYFQHHGFFTIIISWSKFAASTKTNDYLLFQIYFAIHFISFQLSRSINSKNVRSLFPQLHQVLVQSRTKFISQQGEFSTYLILQRLD